MWWFALSILADAQRLMQRETLEVLVAPLPANSRVNSRSSRAILARVVPPSALICGSTGGNHYVTPSTPRFRSAA